MSKGGDPIQPSLPPLSGMNTLTQSWGLPLGRLASLRKGLLPTCGLRGFLLARGSSPCALPMGVRTHVSDGLGSPHLSLERKLREGVLPSWLTGREESVLKANRDNYPFSWFTEGRPVPQGWGPPPLLTAAGR